MLSNRSVRPVPDHMDGTGPPGSWDMSRGEGCVPARLPGPSGGWIPMSLVAGTEGRLAHEGR